MCDRWVVLIYTFFRVYGCFCVKLWWCSYFLDMGSYKNVFLKNNTTEKDLTWAGRHKKENKFLKYRCYVPKTSLRNHIEKLTSERAKHVILNFILIHIKILLTFTLVVVRMKIKRSPLGIWTVFNTAIAIKICQRISLKENAISVCQSDCSKR